MTQPDLVSKLREVIAKVKPLVEKATPMPWSTNSQFIPQASAKILVGSDRRSIAYVGMNPQSKEWETYAQDITNTLLIIAAVNAMDELESLLGREGQAANECQYCNRGIERKLVGVHWVHPIGQEQFECRYSTLDVPTCGPSQPEPTCPECGFSENHLASCSRKPSTPIVTSTPATVSSGYLRELSWRGKGEFPVPGTAGLSAEQVLEIANKHRVTVAGYEFADKFDFEGIAADLNALLAAKPAPVECPGAHEGHRKPCYYCGKPCNDLTGNPSLWSLAFPHRDEPGKVKWHHTGCVLERLIENEREAQIRKDALEEAARYFLSEAWIDNPDNSPLGIAEAIRALAERPAPVGEVKAKSDG